MKDLNVKEKEKKVKKEKPSNDWEKLNKHISNEEGTFILTTSIKRK